MFEEWISDMEYYSYSITGLDGPFDFQEIEAPRMSMIYNRHRPPSSHLEISMKNLIDTTGNRTCGLPGCTAVPQPTASQLHGIFENITLNSVRRAKTD